MTTTTMTTTTAVPTTGKLPSHGGLTLFAALLAVPAITMLRLTPPRPRRNKRDPMVVQVKFQPLTTYGDFSPEPGTNRKRSWRRGH